MGGKKVDDHEHNDKVDVRKVVECVGFVVCFLLFLTIVASVLVFVLNITQPSYTEPEPDISLNIHSFSIAIDNKSSTALCDIALSLRKNIESSYENLNLEIAKASVYYKDDRIWTRPIPPFGLPQGEQIDLRLNLTAWLPGWAAEEFRYGRDLAFDFLLEGIGSYRVEGGLGESWVRVWCGPVMAKYASHSDSGAAVQLVHGPNECFGWLDA